MRKSNRVQAFYRCAINATIHYIVAICLKRKLALANAIAVDSQNACALLIVDIINNFYFRILNRNIYF